MRSREKCIHELFEARAEKTPEAVAVVFEGQRLSYRELDEKANRLAHYLRKRGVGRGSLVGLRVERTMDVVVGVLGVWKAGGGYLPLDLQYPPQRAAFMLQDGKAQLLLTQKGLGEEPFRGVETVCLDSDGEAIAREPVGPVEREAAPDAVAYVIYTSGSTGEPKGVEVAHGNVSRLFSATQPWFSFGEGDVWTLFHSYSFDFSVWEIWGALSYGGRVVVVPRTTSRVPVEFHELLRREGVTVLNQTPSSFRQLIEADRRASGGELSLRWVIFGGEALDPKSLEPWFSKHGDTRPRLVNMYGITETTVHVTFRPLTASDAVSARSVIGRPIPDLQVHILDERQRRVPAGVPGEMYVGGAGVARGYVGRPELTARRFVPDPFDTRTPGRLYRTGDLGRYLADGEIEYLGRIDDQVKIRGYRIEPGEIEAVVREAAGVDEVVVLAREDTPGDKRLVAYFTTEQEPPSVTELREAVKRKLPEYMVPSAFVRLAALPLTPNGKIDRKALPAPDVASLAREAYVSPRTPVEEGLCGLWAEALGVEPIGIHDDFFELGGDSLSATKVIARLGKTFSVELGVRELFEAPAVADFSRRVEHALSAKRPPQGPPLEAVPRGAALPASFAEERLYFLERLDPGKPTYHLPIAVRISGALNAVMLEKALGALATRHETFRTSLVSRENGLFQAISDQAEVTLAQVDLRGQSGESVGRWAEAEVSRAFEMSRGPLFRAALARLSESESLLVLTAHHVVSDGASQGIVLKELGSLYRAFVEGRGSPLAPLERQYADYAVWQRKRLSGEAFEEELAYWKGELGGAAALELPVDHPRPKVQSHRGATVSFAVSQELTGKLEALGRQEGATLFMTLMAAFQVLLGRHSGQEDFCVGTPIAGRTREELELLVGFFVNTLVLRAKLSGRPTFREVLGRVREAAVPAYTHQEVPFERLVEALQPDRDSSRSPVFQVMLQMEDVAEGTLRLPGVEVEPYPVAIKTSKFDLTLKVQEGGVGLQCGFEYSTDLFDEATVRRMGEHFQKLLESVVAHPQKRVAELELLGESERRRLLVEWNDTRAEYPREKCIHELFQAQVEKTPDAVAVVYEGEQLSYRELDGRANQLARHLSGLGVGPEVRVALCVERSLEMVVGLLGILKAGGAYVPLDPAYPSQRLQYMLGQCGAAVVLTQEPLRAGLPLPANVQSLCLDTGWPEVARQSRERIERAAHSENLAYVIYTSGSTGQPKGVGVTHRAVVNLLASMGKRLGMGPKDALLAVTTLSFDIAGLELWLPLSTGARSVIASREAAADGERLLRMAEGSTFLQATPTTWRLLLDAGWSGTPGLTAVCGGEAFTRELAVELKGRCRALWNVYGPTETTIWSTGLRVGSLEGGPAVLPLGRPLDNTRIYLLDAQRALTPVGVSGELFIGGAGVARGYAGSPGLTAERFLPDPFSGEPGARMYRTGDLARYQPDGTLEYLGRVDHQVKVRGFRIELGEIEAALRQHPGVKECLVLAREDAPGEKRLVAYFTAPAEPPPAADLREQVKRVLPEYMVPSAYVHLETLPLTPNGKVDRKALPAPDASATAAEYVGPRTPLEEVLCAVWAEVLGVERVGVHDNFFELGGHSLLLMKAVSAINAALGVKLPVGALFNEPNVVGVVNHFEGGKDWARVQRAAELIVDGAPEGKAT